MRRFAALVGAALLGVANAAAAETTTYQLLLESRADTLAPNEVFLASFATLDDLINANVTPPTQFTQLGISPSFEIAGLTHDPGGYRLLLQSREDALAPNEVFLASFATLDDLINADVTTPTMFTQLGVSPSFGIAGFTYDPGGYRLLLQSREDALAPNEVFLASFATLDDLINADVTTPTMFTQLGISSSFEIAGFAAPISTVGGGNPGGGAVPEPATWALMISGFATAGIILRRRRGLIA